MAPICLLGVPRHARWGDHLPRARVEAEVAIVIEEGDDTQILHEATVNLEGLSMGMSPLPVREILIHMQRHTVVVLLSFKTALLLSNFSPLFSLFFHEENASLS